jgi:hypothetical protein
MFNIQLETASGAVNCMRPELNNSRMQHLNSFAGQAT